MASLIPNLIEKQRIIFVDNVSSEFAEEWSKMYSNVVFFTTNHEIWKDGSLYSKIIGVDENANTIEVNGTIYKLVIESNLLKFKTDFSWYWYVGGNKPNMDTPPQVLDVGNGPNEGWRLITNDESIIRNVEVDDMYNPWLTSFDSASNTFKATNGIGKPLYSPYAEGTTIIEFDEKQFVNGETNIYLFLPYDFVTNYKIGLYDAIGETNFLPNGLGLTEGQYTSSSKTYSHSGVTYIRYKITLSQVDVNEPFKNFTLSLYSKETKK